LESYLIFFFIVKKYLSLPIWFRSNLYNLWEPDNPIISNDKEIRYNNVPGLGNPACICIPPL
jgi:hypothetical protein